MQTRKPSGKKTHKDPAPTLPSAHCCLKEAQPVMATDTGALVVEEERRGSSELWIQMGSQGTSGDQSAGQRVS